MLLKCLSKHHLCWNVLLKDTISMAYLVMGYHTHSSKLYHSLNVQQKDFFELFIKYCKNDTFKNEELHPKKQNSLNLLISKLLQYSRMSECSVKAKNFIISITGYKTSRSPNSKLWAELIDFFNTHNDVTGRQIVENINNHEVEESELLTGAQHAWKKGNIKGAYELFSNIYDEGNIDVQNQILLTIQKLIFYSVANKGKAVVTAAIEGGKKFAVEKNEYSILIAMWYSLFTSEFFEDRCLAGQVLNGSKQLQLCLDKILPNIGYNFLKNHELSNYQRLIETSLQYNMQTSIVYLLRALFSYYYKSGYFKGCAAVYNCCDDLNIKLTQEQLYKYTMLKRCGIKVKRFPLFVPKEIRYKF